MKHVSQFTFQTFSPDDVFDALQTIDFRSSTGRDHSDPFFLKLSAALITVSLTPIFNLSVATDIFPRIWKLSHITPLHKGLSIGNIDNYRQ